MIATAGKILCTYLLARSYEQWHEFETRCWMTPNGLNPTTEHTVTTPRGQPPLVTSTSACCPLRDSGGGAATAPVTGPGSRTRLVLRPRVSCGRLGQLVKSRR
jgi:hypothetical protein